MEKWKKTTKYRNATRPKSFIVKLHLDGTAGRRGFPVVSTGVNGREYVKQIIEGQTTLEFVVDSIQKRNVLFIEMLDKTSKDTVIEGHNAQIVADKRIKIEKLFIDDINLRNHIYDARQRPTYHTANQGPKVVSSDHIFFSGKWRLYFENPPRLYFANKTYSSALVNNPTKQEQVIHFKRKLALTMSKDDQKTQ